jgi:hypothetical protein
MMTPGRGVQSEMAGNAFIEKDLRALEGLLYSPFLVLLYGYVF